MKTTTDVYTLMNCGHRRYQLFWSVHDYYEVAHLMWVLLRPYCTFSCADYCPHLILHLFHLSSAPPCCKKIIFVWKVEKHHCKNTAIYWVINLTSHNIHAEMERENATLEEDYHCDSLIVHDSTSYCTDLWDKYVFSDGTDKRYRSPVWIYPMQLLRVWRSAAKIDRELFNLEVSDLRAGILPTYSSNMCPKITINLSSVETAIKY